MRNRTMAGLVVAGAATVAAVVGGVAYATADENEGEPVVRIVTEQEEPVVGNAAQEDTQPREDCPEKNGQSEAAPSTGTGL